LGLSIDELQLSQGHYDYLRAMKVERALGIDDTYPHIRRRAGRNYSPFVILESAEVVDQATSAMQGCVRAMIREPSSSEFVDMLCDVVGDLHDNVWSHANAPGLSLAQRWKTDKGQNPVHHLEFALADCGIGFLGELQRAGVAQREGIVSDADAIRWCIQWGNTSKAAASDEWAQRLPQDFRGNPMPGSGRIMSENHHLGIGLGKLVNAIHRSQGALWLVSGAALLHISTAGTETYVDVPSPWQGVALACRFATFTVAQRTVDPAVELIEQLLR
jgi:hypothetical protein